MYFSPVCISLCVSEITVACNTNTEKLFLSEINENWYAVWWFHMFKEIENRSSLELIREKNVATPKHEFGRVNWIIWDVYNHHMLVAIRLLTKLTR